MRESGSAMILGRRGGGVLAAITVQFEVGPETRELIERLGGKMSVQVELGPKTREVLEEFINKRASEPQATGVPPAR
jgi:hypothetical protein